MLLLRAADRGDPGTVVRCRERNDPAAPGPGEVLVRLELSPIDPIDRLLIFGAYPGAPTGEWTPGAEGCARVLEAGDGCALKAGRRVVLPINQGAWRALAVHPEDSLCAVPDEVPPEVAATLRINGLSAWVLLTETLGLDAGDWLLQAPGNGGLGRYMIQLARERGIRTLNIVRDGAAAGPLEELGADAVMTWEQLAETPRSELCGGAEITSAIDGVGGDATAQLAGKLASGGRVITYGGVSRKPPRMEISHLVFRGISLEGFWLRDWTRGRAADEVHDAMRAVAAIRPQVESAAVFPFAQCREAFTRTKTTQGRVFLRPA